MIRETFRAFAARFTDVVFHGRNRSRIVIGTDRKQARDTGYGDEGEGEAESASIDLVAGFDGNSGDPSFVNDKGRIYITAKCDPDNYIENDKGEAVEGEAANIHVSDNHYIKARNKVKIVNDNYSIVLNQDGTVEIECSSAITIKADSNKILINSTGIELDCGQGVSGKIITDNDLCVGTDPVSGGPIISNFKQAGSLVNNNKVVVK